MLMIKMIPVGDIPVISDLIAYTQDFIGSLCGLIGLTIGIVSVAVLLHVRKRRGKK